MEVQLIRVVNMAARVLSVGVQAADAVLMEGGGLRAVQDVVEPRWVRQSEDAVAMWMLAEIRIPSFTSRWCPGGQGGPKAYEGSDRGAQTIAILSGIIIW